MAASLARAVEQAGAAARRVWAEVVGNLADSEVVMVAAARAE